MPKQRKTKSKVVGKHHPELPATAPQGVQGLRSLKDRLSMIRFRLWRSKNHAVHAAEANTRAPGRMRGLLSLHQKLGSTLGGSYRYVMNRLAVLRHLHPSFRAKGMYSNYTYMMLTPAEDTGFPLSSCAGICLA